MTKYLATFILLWAVGPGLLQAAPMLDGSIVGDNYGAPRAVQTVQTQFGDNFSELDAAYAQIADGHLYLTLTGNLEGNFNKLNIFIDSVAGGQNTIDAGNNPPNDGWAAKHGGMVFDADFAADYLITLRHGNAGSDKFDFDFAVVGGGATDFDSFLDIFGGTSQGMAQTGAGANLGFDFGIAFDNSNVAGVVGGDQEADMAAAAAVETGIELAIPLSAIGSPMGIIKVSAMVNGSNHDFLSNQLLGGLIAPQGNLGGDGAGNFTGSLSGIDLTKFPENQYFTVPEPNSLALIWSVGLLTLGRRRR